MFYRMSDFNVDTAKVGPTNRSDTGTHTTDRSPVCRGSTNTSSQCGPAGSWPSARKAPRPTGRTEDLDCSERYGTERERMELASYGDSR